MAPKSPEKSPPQPSAQSTAPQIPLRDDPYAPMIYVTELAGGGQQGENYNLTFAALLYDHGEGVTKAYRKTNLRLVIPKIAVPAAVQFLQQLLDAGEKKPEAKPVKEVKGTQTIQ